MRDENTTEEPNLAYYKKYYEDIDTRRKTFEALSCIRNILSINILRGVHGKSYLEVGFGTGLLLEEVIKLGASSIVGVEQEDKAVQYLKRRLNCHLFKTTNNINLITAEAKDAIKLLKNSSFDYIILSHVLEHIRNDVSFLAEIISLLSSDGILIILVPSRWCQSSVLHYRQYNPEDLKGMIEKENFPVEILECRYKFPCLLGILYVYVFPLLIRFVCGNNLTTSTKNNKIKTETRITRIARVIYSSFIVKGMLAFFPIDNLVARYINFGYQSLIVLKKKAT